MQLSDCYYLGTITKTHGLKGELIAFLDTDQPELYKKLESVYLNFEGVLVPFLLKQTRQHKNSHLRFLLDTTEPAEDFIGRELYLPLSSLPPLTGTKFYYHEVIDFSVVSHGQTVGQIKTVLDHSAQDLIEIETKDQKKLLIPLVEEWILRVNRTEKKMEMDLPEGLLDL